MTLYLRLYWEFFKTGLFAIGGGMATLPFLKDIGRPRLVSQTDLMNMLAVSESTPVLSASTWRPMSAIRSTACRARSSPPSAR